VFTAFVVISTAKYQVTLAANIVVFYTTIKISLLGNKENKSIIRFYCTAHAIKVLYCIN